MIILKLIIGGWIIVGFHACDLSVELRNFIKNESSDETRMNNSSGTICWG